MSKQPRRDAFDVSWPAQPPPMKAAWEAPPVLKTAPLLLAGHRPPPAGPPRSRARSPPALEAIESSAIAAGSELAALRRRAEWLEHQLEQATRTPVSTTTHTQSGLPQVQATEEASSAARPSAARSHPRENGASLSREGVASASRPKAGTLRRSVRSPSSHHDVI